ncbi:hypothetical protein P153DRAFT_353273 [Dothidotthia symphoricarpi CBS 119687]|uniref:Zn(2)-C6 fungal-type domain-containing protein n=1 Tax=Dothidotthia symphoricarpi CBS 119687 TaxID=1392245 RepID=A0A6A6AT88_9PLEO|nr:uncharacterized protein P153DRAFT_353273 [Dothidotthia symphoricarpi CBS 119687]KAF2134067.1 hypothetical protein P153DRAFT_353273 [Dothidotthia symphoricarpi CBS 119687]
MSARDTEAESGGNSVDGYNGSPEKRTKKKRRVLSCFACRDRKMKCDRIYPVCGRCQKTGRADQCAYDSRLLDRPRSNGMVLLEGVAASSATSEQRTAEIHEDNASSDTLRWKLRVQERRIEMLERELITKESRTQSQYNVHLPEEPEIKSESMIRGKGLRTQFHGPTSVMTMISKDRALQAFTREALVMDQSLSITRAGFRSIRDRRKANLKEVGARSHGIDAEVFAALPEKSIVDTHVSTYFQTWETTYRILHELSFFDQYQKFWEHAPGDYSQTSFAALLVLMIASTKCLAPKDDIFEGDSTVDREAASCLINIYENWVNRQSRKRLDLLFFQLHCMALLAKRTNCVKIKQDWVSTGEVVRLAMASGMHRDTGGKISEFEKEMKKRIWATIMEFELQSSLETGLQSSLTDLYFDTPPPVNLPDHALVPDSQHMPATLPIENFTPTSFLAVSLESLPLRIHLTQLLNNPNVHLRYDEVLRYDAQLHAFLSSLPVWDDPRATIPSALLDLQLRQYLLIMHRPYAKLAMQNQRFIYSFTACVEAASSIISAHDRLVHKGILALSNLRNDVLRVGIGLSQVVYQNCEFDNSTGPSSSSSTQSCPHIADGTTCRAGSTSAKDGMPDDSLYLAVLPRESFLVRTLIVSSVELLGRAHYIFERKVKRLGTGYMEYWPLSAAISMLPSPPMSSQQATLIESIAIPNEDLRSRYTKALDSFKSLTSEVMSRQKDPAIVSIPSLRNKTSNALPLDSMTGTSFGSPLVTIDDAPYPPIPCLAGGIDASTTSTSNFDVLHDTQLDFGGWKFPDFWEFDLAGDF